jgi:hypothetical protein
LQSSGARAAKLRLYDEGNTNYTELVQPAAGGVDVSLGLPNTLPDDTNNLLRYNTTDNKFEWTCQYKVNAEASTGLIAGGELTVSGSTFDISEGCALIVDNTNPYVLATEDLQWFGAELSGITITNLASWTQTFVGITSGKTIIQQETQFTAA